MWLLYIVKSVPKDTGFLLGAFTPLAEMLDVRMLTPNTGRSARSGLKKSPGLANYRQKLIQSRMEMERRRRFLKAVQEQRRVNRDRQAQNEAAAAEGLSTNSDAALSRREWIEQRNMARYQRRLLNARFRKNRQIYMNLRKRIQRLEKKIKKLRERRVNYRQLRQSIDFTRARYRTVQVPTSYTAGERMKARAKGTPLPAFRTERQRIRPGDPDSFQNVYRKYYYPGRGAGRGPIKTPTSGQRYATPPSEIFREVAPELEFVKGAEYQDFGQNGKNLTFAQYTGSRKTDSTKLTYTFTYDVDIAYYRIMDFLGRYKNHGKTMRPPGTPWFSQRYAEMAFKRFLEQELPKRLPYWTDFKIRWKSTLNKNGAVSRGIK